MTIDFSYFFKKKLDKDLLKQGAPYDFFISAFSKDDRTRVVYDNVNSKNKLWLLFPEYNLDSNALGNEKYFFKNAIDESEYISTLWAEIEGINPESSLCIDVTSFLPHYLIFLLKWLKHEGLSKFDLVYSEPNHYSKRELTQFSSEIVIDVRQIYGFEGNHCSNTSNDLLIINSGYDHKLISNAAEHKDHACKIQLFGFPPLQADMYQENILRARKAEEAVGSISNEHTASLLAPANDPFITANVLSKYIHRIESKNPISNLYLCPLGTKPQTIGMALYYLFEQEGQAASIIYPFCDRYAQQTSVGISDIWKYTIEFQ